MGTRISQFTPLTTVASADYFPLVQASDTTNKRVSLASLLASVPLGSAATPSIAFTGDTNTGIFSPGADQVAISTNGTSRLSIVASGNITVDTDTLYVDATNNRVGVGTASPSEMFTLNNGNILINGNTADRIHFSGDGTKFLSNTGSVSTSILALRGRAGLIFNTGGDSTYNGGTERLRLTSTGALNFVGAGTAGSTQAVSFNGSAPVNSMVLDSSGRLGIGTSAPSAALQVNGSATVTSQANVAAKLGPNLDSDVLLGSVNGNSPFIASQGAYPLDLRTNNASRLRILSDGNVGIGTTTPQKRLDIYDGASNFWFRDNGVNSEIAVVAEAGGLSALYFGDAADDIRGAVAYNSTDDSLQLRGYNNTERARIDSSGRLLVGTSTARDTWFANTLTPQVQIEGASANASALSILRADASSAGARLALGQLNGGSISPLNYTAGEITFQANDGTNLVRTASIASNVDGTPGANDMPGRLVFSVTADGSASPTEAMRINNAGELLVGYTADNGAYKLQVNSQIFATSATIATSDGRYKENVATLDGCVDLVKALRPVSFDWKEQQNITRIDDDGNEVLVREGHNFPGGSQVGFIAQEVEEVLTNKPWLGSVIKQNVRPAVTDNDGNELAPEEEFLGIAEGNLVAVLTSALKDAIGRIESLEAEVAALKA